MLQELSPPNKAALAGSVHVIRRCLESTRPLVDYVLVEDTGSTDGTQEIIRAYLRDNGIPRGRHRGAVARFRL